jgi:Uncharacterized protein conserved in bacteria (DUF2066)
MHRAAKFIADHAARPLAALLLLSAPLSSAESASLQSPYVVTVPQNDPTQAIQDAMRVELVRLTGTREAVTDQALAPLVDTARQYVQIERGTTSGQTQVLFDAAALRAAIEAAGRSVWDLNRPLLWISLPVEDATTDQLLRNRLAVAAEERGLPIMIAPPLASASPPSTPGTVLTPGAAPPGAPPSAMTTQLLDAAHRVGANAALVASAASASSGSLQWTLAAPTTGGQWTGGPEFAIENATEALSSAARAIDQVPLAEYECQINGVNDLAGLVNVLSAVHDATGISDYTIEDVQGGQLTLRLKAHANADQVQRMLTSDRLQMGGSPGGVLQYRYLSGP